MKDAGRDGVRTRRRARVVEAIVATAVLCTFLAVAAGPAQALVRWEVTSIHGPENMPLGDGSQATVEGQYLIEARNMGTNNTSATTTNPIVLHDVLPAGVTVAAIPTGTGWTCANTVVGSGQVTCERRSGTVTARGNSATSPGLPTTGTHAFNRGYAPRLVVPVSVEVASPTVAENSVSITGGCATALCGGVGSAVPATATDPTRFDSTPAGFGLHGFAADGVSGPTLFDGPEFSGERTPERQAGSHPFELLVRFSANLGMQTSADLGTWTTPENHVRTLVTRLPAGLIGNPRATPQCPLNLLGVPGWTTKAGHCPTNTQIGTIDVRLNEGASVSENGFRFDIPVYNLEPPPGVVAAFGFAVNVQPIIIEAEVDPADHHSVVTRAEYTTETFVLRSVDLTLWGVPGDPAHDLLRLNPDNSTATAMNTRFTGAPIRPFLTLPTQCDTAGSIEMRADSWQKPDSFTPWYQGASIQATGCDDPRIEFEPSISIQPTSHQAASPTGLDVELNIPQTDDSLESGDQAANAAAAAKLYAQNGDDAAIVTPNVRNAVTRLPEGMAVNPSAADGLVGCSEAQIGLDDNDPAACPDNSKIGTVEIDSPLMGETMHGFIYQAKQNDNPFGTTLAFYTVAEGEGLTIKLPAKVQADPDTGRLTTTFTDNPQLTFSHYRLHFWGGDRAPLVNPPTCGSYQGTGTVSSWNSSMPVANVADTVNITSGPGGAPCARPFAPSFDAKSLTPIAGAFSTFALEASRADGSQELRGIETTLPPGMTGKLAGIPYCPESAIAAVSTVPGSGLGQRLSPSCPAASLVGHSDAAAGAGALPFHNPGNVYLAGPYKGAPLSLAIVTPVVAGPLDLGSIVVRAALYVDPVTAQIRVVSDPIPDRIVADGNGFPLNVRSVRVTMDRPSFTLNPTSCEAMSVDGSLTSLQGANAKVSDRFQVGACAALDFAPKLSLRLKGKTGRGGHPSLRAALTMPGGSANVARAAVTLPHSEFLDQAHIGTVCTRVQYAAGAGGGTACPAASVYGHATAWSPLLDRPLSGPVFLRSSSHELPDLVASLDGQIHVDLAGTIDSVHGGLRSRFGLVPDAPVSKFVLTMRGGKKGLLQNSTNVCRGAHRATTRFDAHSGKVTDSRPALVASGCGGKPRKG